jgi:hypothetical protein
MYDLNPDNKPLALGCWTRAFHYPARIGDRNPSDFFQVFASNYSRERVASQCDKPIKAQMETIKTPITSNIDTAPSCSMTNTGPTTSAILKNTTTQANGCAKLMVHPIHGRRRGTITRGSSAHRYTMPQLFGLAQSWSSSLRFTAVVSMRPNYSFILLRPTPRNLAWWPEHSDGGKST